MGSLGLRGETVNDVAAVLSSLLALAATSKGLCWRRLLPKALYATWREKNAVRLRCGSLRCYITLLRTITSYYKAEHFTANALAALVAFDVLASGWTRRQHAAVADVSLPVLQRMALRYLLRWWTNRRFIKTSPERWNGQQTQRFFAALNATPAQQRTSVRLRLALRSISAWIYVSLFCHGMRERTLYASRETGCVTLRWTTTRY